ncbi:hypothetical protein QQP08_019728 [Theobroma cacao]|nr:hypothetical protein QQP08_019728 [Theobroma cacao]
MEFFGFLCIAVDSLLSTPQRPKIELNSGFCSSHNSAKHRDNYKLDVILSACARKDGLRIISIMRNSVASHQYND